MKFKIVTLFSAFISFVIAFNGIASNFGKNPIHQNLKKKQPEKHTSAPTTGEGKKLYEKYCLACHQTNGSGVPGMYPPLRKSEWASGDKKRLVNILLKGLSGEIVVKGNTYDQAMPKVDYLTNDQIALILTFVRRDFNNLQDSVTPQMVKAERVIVR